MVHPKWSTISCTPPERGRSLAPTATAGTYKGDSILYLTGWASSPGGIIKVFAFDANGPNGCGGSFCLPLWTDQASGELSSVGAGAVSVANGYAYVGGAILVGSGQGTLFAFDQNGVTDCTSGTCSPVFQTSARSKYSDPRQSGRQRHYGVRNRQRTAPCIRRSWMRSGELHGDALENRWNRRRRCAHFKHCR